MPAVLLCWGPALLHPLTLLPTSPGGDLISRFAPLRDFGFSRLRAGHLPLWDPLILGGVPNLGGLESALLYPPNWLHLLLPLTAALNLVLLLHLWLGGALSALFARRLGASRAGAALAGLCWCLGGAVWPRLRAGHPTMLCALAWAPLVYAAAESWLAGGRRRWLAVGAAAFGLQLLAGYPETAYHTALGVLAYAALRPLAGSGSRAAAGLAAMLAAGALVAAAQLLPAAEAALESARAGAGYAFSSSFSLPPESLLTLLAPLAFGGGAGPHFGRLYFWETSLFFGASALTLSLACPAPRRRPLLGGALILLVLSLGSLTPAYRALYAVLPGLRYFRGPSKLSAQALLLLSSAAALGYDAAAAQPARRRLSAAALAAAAALALGCASAAVAPAAARRALEALLAAPESFVAPALRSDPQFLRYAAASVASALGAAAAVLLLAAGALKTGRRGALWALAAAELVVFARAQRSQSPAREPVPAALASTLAADPGGYRFMTHWPSHPNLGLVLGRPEVWGYDQMVLARWAELAAWTQGRPSDAAGLYQPVERLTPRAALLGARYAYRDEPPRVERAPVELPRAFVARALPVAPGQALAAMSRPGFSPARQAYVEAAASALPDPGTFAGGSAEVAALSSDELEVHALAPGGGVVVLTDAYSAGWSARALPGSAQGRYEVLPADHALRGVPVGPGEHRFRLAYEPRTWRLGLAASLLGLLLLAALATA